MGGGGGRVETGVVGEVATISVEAWVMAVMVAAAMVAVTMGGGGDGNGRMGG